MTEGTAREIPGINPGPLEQWFAEHIPECSLPLHFTLIAGGQSNLTFKVEDAASRRFVLRRPPMGSLPPRAHDVAREYRIQAALRDTTVPVPHVVGVCTDRAVNGADFYVMEWVDGTIVDSTAKADEFLATPRAKRVASHHLIDAFSTMHRVDLHQPGLAELSRHEDYVGRNLERMHQVWQKTKTREYPLIEALHQKLIERQPPQKYTALIHSDYRFGNVMLDAEFRVIAILDWELWTIGDPLADLGFFINNWDLPEDPWPDVWTAVAPTRAGGFPSREEIIGRYAASTGFDVADIDYYRAFNYWRIAVIAEGIKRRYLSGAMAEQAFDTSALERRVRDRAELSEYFLSRSTGNAAVNVP